MRSATPAEGGVEDPSTRTRPAPAAFDSISPRTSSRKASRYREGSHSVARRSISFMATSSSRGDGSTGRAAYPISETLRTSSAKKSVSSTSTSSRGRIAAR